MTIELAKEVLDTEISGLKTVRDRLGDEFSRAVDLLMTCPTRVVVAGIGKSGLVGQKISATLNSTGTPSFFLHPVEALHGDLGMVAATDVALLLSYSGETFELNRLLGSLSHRVAAVIAITAKQESTLGRAATVTLNVDIPREACPLGLAPTTSTTATLALGDALAVALLQRKGFCPEDFRRNHPGGSLGERLKVMVAEVMLKGKEVPKIGEECSFSAALNELNSKSLGAVLVCDKNNRLVGILTDGDIRRLLLDSTDVHSLKVKAVMTRAPEKISADIMAVDALSLMQEREITVLPVVTPSGELQGILHLHDLLGKGEFKFLI